VEEKTAHPEALYRNQTLRCNSRDSGGRCRTTTGKHGTRNPCKSGKPSGGWRFNL